MRYQVTPDPMRHLITAALPKRMVAQQRELPRAAQRLWIQYRDVNCLYYGLGESTIARIEAGECTEKPAFSSRAGPETPPALDRSAQAGGRRTGVASPEATGLSGGPRQRCADGGRKGWSPVLNPVRLA